MDGWTDGQKDRKMDGTYTLFFSPSLDVLIFWAFSASNVLKGVLNLISYKFLESCLKKVVEMISDEMFNNSKKNPNIYHK